MRGFLMAAGAAAAFTVSLGAAEAMPLAPVDSLAAAPAVTLVSGGCGPFAHRGFYGACRPNFGGPRPYGFYGHPYFHPYHRFYGPRPYYRY